MKRIFLLVLCAALMLTFVACSGPSQSPDTDSSVPGTNSAEGSDSGTDLGTDSGSVTDSATDTDSKDTSTESSSTPRIYDATLEHKIIATDIKNNSIVVFDLNKCGGDWDRLTDDSCVVWEWVAAEDENCKLFPGSGLDDAKYRYSAYWKRDVVLVSSSSGWAGVIDYQAKTILWEARVSYGPHSIEMMPNGDLLVACSGNSNWETRGCLVYFPLSTGMTTSSSSLSVPSCHGVQYDPEQDLLWVLGYYEIFAVRVSNYGSQNATLVKDSKKMDTLERVGGASGHDLSPMAGEPGSYLISCGKGLWKFDSQACKLFPGFERSSTYTEKNIKGIAWFSDGTAVETVAGVGEKLYASWSTKALRVIVLTMSSGKVSRVKAETSYVYFTDREFYKVHAFNKDYQ